MIESLPRNLSALDDDQLREARDRRDARMSILFGGWPSLTKVEMTELKRLSDERQRLARHVGILRGLHELRAPASHSAVAWIWLEQPDDAHLDVRPQSSARPAS